MRIKHPQPFLQIRQITTQCYGDWHVDGMVARVTCPPRHRGRHLVHRPVPIGVPLDTDRWKARGSPAVYRPVEVPWQPAGREENHCRLPSVPGRCPGAGSPVTSAARACFYSIMRSASCWSKLMSVGFCMIRAFRTEWRRTSRSPAGMHCLQKRTG